MNDEIEIIESIPTKIKYKGIIWVPQETDNACNSVRSRNPKKPYFVKWVEARKSGDVFTLDQFYTVYPKLKKDCAGRKRIDRIIFEMITDKRIMQLGSERFKVA